eukprot:scaffold38425_cov266-Skeletonema_dohrnii-CCMP3373.AAC.1
MSNKIRDGTMKVFQRIAPLAQYCKSKHDVDTERKGVVPKMKHKRPFDWYFLVNHHVASKLSNSTYLSEIGFDVVCVPPSSSSDITQDSTSQEVQQNSLSYLEDGEKK